LEALVRPSTVSNGNTTLESKHPMVQNAILEALSSLNSRFDTLEANMDTRFYQVNDRIKELEPDMVDAKAILAAIQALAARFDKLEAHMNRRFEETNAHIQELADSVAPSSQETGKPQLRAGPPV
ncbi:hypothetical protein C0995_007694, partial [Termitomyces sp. Mi166